MMDRFESSIEEIDQSRINKFVTNAAVSSWISMKWEAAEEEKNAM